MKASFKYAAAGTVLVALLTLGLWPFVGPAARRGILLAAAVALPLQIAAFSLLIRFRGRINGFVAVWAGGTLFRMAVVGVAALVAVRSGMDGAVAMLLALAGFFFALLLIEPLYFRVGPRSSA